MVEIMPTLRAFDYYHTKIGEDGTMVPDEEKGVRKVRMGDN